MRETFEAIIEGIVANGAIPLLLGRGKGTFDTVFRLMETKLETERKRREKREKEKRERRER